MIPTRCTSCDTIGLSFETRAAHHNNTKFARCVARLTLRQEAARRRVDYVRVLQPRMFQEEAVAGAVVEWKCLHSQRQCVIANHSSSLRPCLHRLRIARRAHLSLAYLFAASSNCLPLNPIPSGLLNVELLMNQGSRSAMSFREDKYYEKRCELANYRIRISFVYSQSGEPFEREARWRAARACLRKHLPNLPCMPTATVDCGCNLPIARLTSGF